MQVHWCRGKKCKKGMAGIGSVRRVQVQGQDSRKGCCCRVKNLEKGAGAGKKNHDKGAGAGLKSVRMVQVQG